MVEFGRNVACAKPRASSIGREERKKVCSLWISRGLAKERERRSKISRKRDTRGS